MGDIEAPDTTGPRQSVLQTILPIAKEFASSRKGQLLIAEVALSLIAFICFVASTAAAFVTAPLIEFLAALFLLFAYSTKFNERFKGFHFPLMVFGFIATIVFALDFYFIFNDLANFLKKGGDSGDEPPRTSDYNDSDSDSD
ncbi:CKLF-like MARVEL transmembrane domain-containing protein 3 isoform X2 [Coregonus clupeaformis]|uniref:CKLF-like MARVEL transmembrane domain-containing protein 3 isoform X2 n=1 Tax=Coregonus clupeaformis TaxID=59861 RepID=UPI001BE0E0D6|nr:CKLF-like MARVEL transmembrane domain-containing protein 3 isoform X2 [Coregonus clupeaformis]